MSDEADRLFELLQDPSCYEGLNHEDLRILTYFGISLYGKTNQDDLIGRLISLYQVFRVKIGRSERQNLHGAIQNQLLEGEISVNAMLPFVLEETDFSICSTAALDYASCRPLSDEDPMSGPGEVNDMILQDRPKCRPGLFAGLLLLGDVRVNRILWDTKDIFSESEIQQIAKCRSGFLYKTTIEFYLDWLESLRGDFRDRNFGSIASGLVLARENLMMEQVLDCERIFPVPRNAPPGLIRQQFDLPEFAETISDRLLALEMREPSPKVMPEVLRAWRIPRFTMH
ncbi:MAG: hypothetical protein HOB79_09705 [Rhodospirillaceae bacterium]|nr:hypothetical protein [Rhodospirillaceae bacterium]